MADDKKIFALILAGGSGSRMKSKEKKQFLEFHNTPLFIWSIKEFYLLNKNYPLQITLTYSQGDKERFQEILGKHIPEIPIELIEGGKERNDSVYNGLKKIRESAGDKDFILIHDSARPFIQFNDIINIIETLNSYPSATLGYKITDTIKKINIDDEKVDEHLKRNELRGILTPQAFHFGVIWTAYEKFLSDPYPVTDDTEIVESMGYPAIVVEGSKTNIKITTPEDLIFAEEIFSKKLAKK